MKKVMISSTEEDLIEHRELVKDTCLRLGLYPILMQHLPASNHSAIAVDEAMVGSADVYVGIYGCRYGTIGLGQQKSYTELEFDHAVTRGIPCLIFEMSDDHLVPFGRVETTPGAQEKLKQFKQKATAAAVRIRKKFTCPKTLDYEVMFALQEWKQEDEKKHPQAPAPAIHAVTHIPPSREWYIAHPYALLQASGLVGRRMELELLTDWITANHHVSATTRIFSVIAMGGMGKSALTWKWFKEVVPEVRKDLAGAMWWSFYESDAHWENFIIRALAYVAGITEQQSRDLSPAEREERLLRLLDERPFLLVLDGLERILLAYSRLDAARMSDDDPGPVTPEIEREQDRLRQCSDPRAGNFLKRLAQVRASRILISSRLLPAELEIEPGIIRPGGHVLELRGLSDDDAVALWRAFLPGEESGTREELIPLFNSIDNYPLLIPTLANQVARHAPAPGNFKRWRQDHPDLGSPARSLTNERKARLLSMALRGLDETEKTILHTMAAFRMPAPWDTLKRLFIGKGKLCRNLPMLVNALRELQERGLLGWDPRSNRYDLHPVVRGVVWENVDGSARKGIFTQLRGHFSAMPAADRFRKDVSIDDFASTIELYNVLIGLEEFTAAWELFDSRLFHVLQYHLSATRKVVELLEAFFPDGMDSSPCVPGAYSQGMILRSIGEGTHRGGEPRKSIRYYERCLDLTPELETGHHQIMSDALALVGSLRRAYQSTLHAGAGTDIRRKTWLSAVILFRHGRILSGIGHFQRSNLILRRAQGIFHSLRGDEWVGSVYCALAQNAMWAGGIMDPKLVQQAWEIASTRNFERDFCRAARMRGVVALKAGDLPKAKEWLTLGLMRSRGISYVEEELPAATALADLHRQEGDLATARQYLEPGWRLAERGPYPLLHADALNVLAQIHRDAGNPQAAIDSATRAYQLAWCDGPPYAYHFGLLNARKHLQALGVPEPVMPPYDESKFEPLPNVDLNPKDQFWIDPDSL